MGNIRFKELRLETPAEELLRHLTYISKDELEVDEDDQVQDKEEDD